MFSGLGVLAFRGMLLNIWRFAMKPGDLVEPDWAEGRTDKRQLGLVLSYPEVKDHGTTCVKVNWIGYEMEEYYSVHHLKLVENEG